MAVKVAAEELGVGAPRRRKHFRPLLCAALASRQIANRRGDLGAFTAEPAKARVLARSFAVLAAIDGGAFTLPEAED